MDAEQRARLDMAAQGVFGAYVNAADLQALLAAHDAAMELVGDALPALKSWTRNGDHEGSSELYDRAKRLVGED